ncbi:uncharacterized protein LOC119069154 [Bradysia coprophila]|uniref:uncharacterized protein LOC119069154 n=1 Tax=Bradysia coprophila TaxID=38358 RepID=UPI00187DB7FE|nr:uncharacterized protein LOC119069154 [Bradysia coprophila]
MSHSVTITRTVTTSNTTSTLVVNTGYLKTVPGLLKLVQLILGAVCVGLASWYYNNRYDYTPSLFFLLMATTFLVGTFCLLVSCLFSLSTGGIISKTIYELIYHSIGAILLIAASITLLIHVNKNNNSYYHEKFLIAAIIGLINGILYVVSAILARRSYRGI